MFTNWTITNWISLSGLIFSFITASFLIANFFTTRKITKNALAINQFNIYNDELKAFKQEALNILFIHKYNNAYITKHDIEKANGISYIKIFTFTTIEKNYTSYNTDILLDTNYLDISVFRNQVIYPIEKFYSKLFKLLQTIKNDGVLLKDYKIFLYNKVERELLQDYLRVCNFEEFGKKVYHLEIFKSEGYNADKFYKINNFYIENKLFNFNELDFYKTTN